MRLPFIFVYILATTLCNEYFIDNSANFSKEDGTLQYPFQSMEVVLSYYLGFSNSVPLFHIIILSNTYNYSINATVYVTKPLQISVINDKNKVGLKVYGSFQIEENGSLINYFI